MNIGYHLGWNLRFKILGYNLGKNLGYGNIGYNSGKNLGFANLGYNLGKNRGYWNVGYNLRNSLRTIILVTILVRILASRIPVTSSVKILSAESLIQFL